MTTATGIQAAAAGAAAATAAAGSTGFELYEKMVAEYKSGGKSPTLDQWLSQVRQQMAQLKGSNASPKAQKDLATIERACALAAELATTLGSAKK